MRRRWWRQLRTADSGSDADAAPGRDADPNPAAPAGRLDRVGDDQHDGPYHRDAAGRGRRAVGDRDLPGGQRLTTLALTLSASAPASAPALQSVRRRPQTLGTSVSPLAYLTVQPSADVSFNPSPALTLNVASPPSGNAYLAYYDPTAPSAGWNAVAGPGTISGTTIQFAAQPRLLALAKGTTYTFAVVTTTGALATPTPTPSPVPSPAPLVLNLPNLQFLGVGAAYAQTLTVSQAGYGGLFTLGGTSCNGITVTNTTSDPKSFTITPVSNGICSYTMTGAPGSQVTVPVTVTTLTVGGQ